MWNLLDPPECKKAQECLEQGHWIEAAEILLQSRYPEHRRLKELRRKVQEGLFRQAHQVWQERFANPGCSRKPLC